MFDLLKMGGILTMVGMICTFFLASTNAITREPIAEAKRQETVRMLSQLSPPGSDNEPDRDSVTFSDTRLNRKAKPALFYRVRKGATNLAAIYIVTAPDGYSGDIEIMMSVLPGGVLNGIQVVTHKETPGLGDKIVLDTKWVNFFKGKSLNNKLAVKKDGGEFDQFAGATITPRAVVNAVKRGLEFFKENEAKIFSTPATVAESKK